MLQQLRITTAFTELLPLEADISNYEAKFNVTLPTYLKDFLMTYGGQCVEEKYFIVDDILSDEIISFFTLNQHRNLSSVEGISNTLMEVYGKIDFIPFAIVSARILFVKITGENASDIYYYRNEHDDENLLLRYENFTFESLINSLSSVDPGDEV